MEEMEKRRKFRARTSDDRACGMEEDGPGGRGEAWAKHGQRCRIDKRQVHRNKNGIKRWPGVDGSVAGLTRCSLDWRRTTLLPENPMAP